MIKMIKQSFISFTILLCVCCLFACDDDVNKSDVIMYDAPKLVQETATTTFDVNVSSSKIKWMAAFKFMPGEHNGNIKIKEGKLVVNGDEIIGGTIILDMKSMNNNDLNEANENAKLMSHLKSAKLFYTDSFPIARFEIESVTYTKDETKKAQQCKISGVLNIKGVPNNISFPAEIENINDKIMISASFKLDGKRWHLFDSSGSTLVDAANEKEIGADIDFQWNIKAEKAF